MIRVALVVVAALGLGSVGCTVRNVPEDAQTFFPDTNSDVVISDSPVFMCPHMAGIVCNGMHAVTCAADGSMVGTPVDCTMHGGLCFDGTGCAACIPGSGHCDAMGRSVACSMDGSGYAAPVACDAMPGDTCDPGTGLCTSPCLRAESAHSYIGCDYWPTPTINAYLHRDVFHFAVAIANPGDTPVTATFTRGASTVATQMVPAHGLSTVTLPWIDELEGGNGSMNFSADPIYSAIVPDGAYHLTTSAPVTAYQFNALEYEDDSSGFPRYSYSNDASLLLPHHVLTGHYIVISRPTNFVQTVLHNPSSGDAMNEFHSPGFFAVVAVDPHVSVTVSFTANALASMDGTTVRTFAAGTSGTFALSQGEVLQVLSDGPTTCTPVDHETGVYTRLPAVDAGGVDGGPGMPQVTSDAYYCDVGREYDLTGSTVTATGGAVEVVSGHNCDFVPFNRWACDHLEQVVFPLEAWGHDAIFSVSEPLRGEPNVVRVVSGHDANTISFEPASVHAPVTLNSGEFVEFEVRDHFRATGTNAFQLVQYMVAGDYAGYLSSSGVTDGTMAQSFGDPSMSLVIPTQQYRTEYTFLAPMSYTQSYLNVTAPDASTLMLDGMPFDPSASGGWTEVGTTGFHVARVPISGGTHEITSTDDTTFGIVVYGFGSYTSYMYPGGLDLAPINPLG